LRTDEIRQRQFVSTTNDVFALQTYLSTEVAGKLRLHGNLSPDFGGSVLRFFTDPTPRHRLGDLEFVPSTLDGMGFVDIPFDPVDSLGFESGLKPAYHTLCTDPI